ncbi:hypothetical protein DERP_005957, partial [Dermatophagoides pteronyssinus]
EHLPGSSLTVDELLSISRVEKMTKEENRKTMTFQRCLYLNESLIDEICHSDRRLMRKDLLENLHLRSCRRFKIERSLSKHLYSLVINSTDCSRILKELIILDNLVEDLACEYESILHRYDCQAKWSVVWTCRDCKLAYRDWLCSVIIPYHLYGNLIKPCQSVCEQVQQKCPHLHPYGKGQYAGEPVFLCIDPNIPFNKKITPNIPFGDEGQCYDQCDLEPCYNDENESPVLDCPNVQSSLSSSKSQKPFNEMIDNDNNNDDEIQLIDQFNETAIFDYSAEQFNTDMDMIDNDNNNEMIDDNFDDQQQTTEFSSLSSLSTTTPIEEIDLGDNFFDDTDSGDDKIMMIAAGNAQLQTMTTTTTTSSTSTTLLTKKTKKSTTTTNQPNKQWINDEIDDDDDEYTISEQQQQQQTAAEASEKSSKIIKINEKQLKSEKLQQQPQQEVQTLPPSSSLPLSSITTTTTNPSTIDPQIYVQEIYREQLSQSTTNDPFDTIINEQQQQQLNDEINIVVKDFLESQNIMKSIDQKHWSKSSSSPTTTISSSESTKTKTTTESIISETMPPAGTESTLINNNNNVKQQTSDNIVNNTINRNISLQNNNHLYRHYNSRNKDKNLQPKQQSKFFDNDQLNLSIENSQRSPRAASSTKMEKNSQSSLSLYNQFIILLLINIIIIM